MMAKRWAGTLAVAAGLASGCRPVAPGSTTIPTAADIAANETEVALAWVEPTGSQPTLRFSRLGPDLEVLVDKPLVELELDASVLAGRDLAPIAIATLPAGWAVAGWTELGLYLHAIDSAGHDLARTRVVGPRFDVGDVSNTFVRLASQPNGGPLWVWQVDATAQAAVVSSDGTSTSAVIDILGVDSLYALSDAVFAGGAFYVVFAPRVGNGLRVARISPAGELLGVDNLLDDTPVSGPSLVAGAEGPRAVYWTRAPERDEGPDPFLGALVLQDLAANGGPPSAPQYTDGVWMASTSAVALGTGTFLAMAVATSTPSVAAARLDENGVMVQAPSNIGMAPELKWQRAVRRGADAVVAWVGDPGGLHLARVSP